MAKKRSSISKATSYEEIGEFWDTHDVTDYLNNSKEEECQIEIESEVTLYPIAKSLSEQIRLKAQKEGISSYTLVNLWLQEKLKEEQS